MRVRRFFAPLCAAALVLASVAPALADTIRLRDGSVIRGQIVSFRDQQFTVLIGSGSRGRRSRITLYMEDVESIEFDAATANVTETSGGGDGNSTYDAQPSTQPAPQPTPARTNAPVTTTRPQADPPPRTTTAPTTTAQPNPAGASNFIQINVRVRADNTANGWTNSGFVVRRGQRLRITSSGRVSLGGGLFSTPTGLPRVPDTAKLMRDQPTGGLIAVIGDDNDDFLFLGSSREFVAQRDGTLFLGVNEGNLNDNTGFYDTLVEAEP
ncbi:MAG TPA: hypothetical protein VGV38_18495 [Pyrinomonadaceae bacterium]|nr:hypothetical protein [Pyrinomonadaceae bacterium]